MKDIIYIDHAAATPLDERVIAAMQPYFSEHFFNPSSPYQPARDVRNDYEAAKAKIASSIGAKADELIMTAGATESINLAFHHVTGHVVTTTIEHPAVLQAAKQHPHTLVDVDKFGRVNISAIEAAITSETELVSVGLANSEIGTVQPMSDIAGLVQKIRSKRLDEGNNTPLYLHTDASQGIGQIDVHIGRLGVDLLTLNSAKMYGPKQVGLLFASRSVPVNPVVVGGGQERGLRSGTENVAGVIGFATAIKLAEDNRKEDRLRLQQLRNNLQKTLTDAFPDMIISGHPKHRLASHLHVAFTGIDGERLVFLLEQKGILVATGSACAANKGTRSHVLQAIGHEPEVIDGSLRLTLGHLSNEANIVRAADCIIEVVNNEYKRVSR